eukprot:10301835-Alexandrium_andersonii.AAC.1
MLAKSGRLGSSRCAGRATMAESPRGQGRTPSTEAHWGLFRASAKWAPHSGRDRSDRATWGAASPRP